MAFMANTSSRVSEFQMICFPGIQSWQHWLSIPLACLFLIGLAANSSLLITIYSAPSLHQPMYYFLCFLAFVDLSITLSVTPKALTILWFDLQTTSLAACFSQMYIIYVCQGMQSSIFMFLAYDRYIAICNPLRYSSIITKSLTSKAASLMLTSSAVFSLPFPLLASKLHYCENNKVEHCFCENLPVAQLACDSHTVSSFYSLGMLTIFLGFNTAVMAYSYIMIIQAVLRLRSSKAAFKALSTCGSHLILIGFFYITMIAAATTNRAEQSMPKFAHILLTVLQYLAPPAFHPVVYGICTQEIRHTFQKLLARKRHSFPRKRNWRTIQLLWNQGK
ncbi:olfactory receptor 56A1-like [Pleurodeles waltl]|uniref:olfactory receptor 56A1-like n=1 Tax=Pleurodeles waltl TaxID=8319 RepID=UPI0037097077